MNMKLIIYNKETGDVVTSASGEDALTTVGPQFVAERRAMEKRGEDSSVLSIITEEQYRAILFGDADTVAPVIAAAAAPEPVEEEPEPLTVEVATETVAEEEPARGSTWGAPIVDVESIESIQEDDAVLTAAGINAADYEGQQFFDSGTEMMAGGTQVFKSYARNHADLPPAREAFADIVAAIESESRRVLPPVMADDLRVVDVHQDGGITVTAGGGGLRLDPYAARQLVTTRLPAAFPNAWNWLKSCTPEEMGEQMNQRLARIQDFYPEGKVPEVVVAQRFNHSSGNLEGFRVTSASYADMPGDKVLSAYAGMFEAMDVGGMSIEDPRALVTYDQETTSFTAKVSWHAPETFKAVVGSTFEFGHSIRSDDRGGSGFHGSPFGRRIRCINCTVLEMVAAIKAMRHRTSKNWDADTRLSEGLKKFTRRTEEQIVGMGPAIQHFATRWDLLARTPIDSVVINGERHTDPEAAIKALVSDGQLSRQMGVNFTLDGLLSNWAREPGQTLADLVNAWTAYAHNVEMSAFDQMMKEAAIGKVLIPALSKKAEKLKAMPLPTA
jgi:hypothetical protein